MLEEVRGSTVDEGTAAQLYRAAASPKPTNGGRRRNRGPRVSPG
jgi:hypothetical protein